MLFYQYICILFLILFSLDASAQNDKRTTPIDESSYKKHVSPNWASHTMWDDGLAEVATYEANQRIYGKNRTYECVYITVKEVFNQAHNVKTDDYSRTDLFDVLKVNRFERIEMEQYPYHYASNFFFKRNEPLKIHKMTISSQEWCGSTFKVYKPLADKVGYRIYYHSYWDGEGEGEKVEEGDFLFEDQLPFTLRMMELSQGLQFNARLMPSQMSAKVGPIYADLAVFRVGSTKFTLNETEIEAWKVNVQLDLERANMYVIEKAHPNRLLEIKTWNQRNLRLKQIKRYAYWE